MTWAGFELTILASEQAKTVHALDRSATVTHQKVNMHPINYRRYEDHFSCFLQNKIYAFVEQTTVQMSVTNICAR
jgi:hypothetical protein